MPLLRLLYIGVFLTLSTVSTVTAQDVKPSPGTPEQTSIPNASRAPGWVYVRDDDVLAAKAHDKFALEGKYIQTPKLVTSTPRLVVVCDEGKVKQSFIVVGAVVAKKEHHSDLVPYLLPARIDGKKENLLGNAGSTDGQAVYFTRVDLKKILDAHLVIVGADEYLGAQVVMQFDMPDPAEVLSKCGKDRILKANR